MPKKGTLRSTREHLQVKTTGLNPCVRVNITGVSADRHAGRSRQSWRAKAGGLVCRGGASLCWGGDGEWCLQPRPRGARANVIYPLPLSCRASPWSMSSRTWLPGGTWPSASSASSTTVTHPSPQPPEPWPDAPNAPSNYSPKPLTSTCRSSGNLGRFSTIRPTVLPSSSPPVVPSPTPTLGPSAPPTETSSSATATPPVTDPPTPTSISSSESK